MQNKHYTGCWFCGKPLIWNSDFDKEDCGYEGEGIVTFLSCSGCGAMWEGVQSFEEEEQYV